MTSKEFVHLLTVKMGERFGFAQSTSKLFIKEILLEISNILRENDKVVIPYIGTIKFSKRKDKVIISVKLNQEISDYILGRKRKEDETKANPKRTPFWL